jgi:dTDP-4-amino-4,6-dideoxygalactose transaminase
MEIPFNIPFTSGKEIQYINELYTSKIKFSGDGKFTKMCHKWFEEYLKTKKSFLTTSCTHALEIAALLCDIKQGDEVIMPSFTFVSTANAFVLRGARIVFVDIRPDTMNINEKLLEDAITPQTKAIVVVHYAGVSCEMNAIMDIARKNNLYVIEDAAQAIGATYNGKALGSLGHLGAISFHDTKNIHCGEGGSLLVNEDSFIAPAEIFREKGTNRSKFLRGEVDKYTWVDVGSSYLPSELNAAVLLPQLEQVEEVTKKRRLLWQTYFENFHDLENKGVLELPKIPEECQHNGHIFYIKLKNIDDRQDLIDFLKKEGIYSVFHYIPLHSSRAGHKFGRFHGKDEYTTIESERLLRLPMFYSLTVSEVENIVKKISFFFNSATRN